MYRRVIYHALPFKESTPSLSPSPLKGEGVIQGPLPLKEAEVIEGPSFKAVGVFMMKLLYVFNCNVNKYSL